MSKATKTAALNKLQDIYEINGLTTCLNYAFNHYSHLGNTGYCEQCECDVLVIDDTCCACGTEHSDDLTKIIHSRALLFGLASLDAVSCRTEEALDILIDFRDFYRDYRDEIPEDFINEIKKGNIRQDTMWSKGSDKYLLSLVTAQIEK